jgi:hypothetical protein
MSIRVWHMDDQAILDQSPDGCTPQIFIDAKMGFRQDGSQQQACAELFAQGFYRLAGSVEGNDLESAFHLTNHIDHSWTENTGVEPTDAPQRSSSVGDLFEVVGAGWHVCASVGFESMPAPTMPTAPSPAKKRSIRSPK